MKKTLIIIISVLILLAGFIGYKGFIYNKYKIEGSPFIKLIDFNKKIQISKLEPNEEKVYSQYKNIEFLVNENFIFNEEESNSSDEVGIGFNAYYLNYESTNVYGSQIRIGNNFKIYESLINNDYTIYNKYANDMYDVNIKEIFEKHDIKDNKSLYYAIFKDSNRKVNITSSKEELQYIYILRTLSNIILMGEEFYFIDGDLNGYIVNVRNKIYEAHLYINNEEYIISFWNNKEEYFNLDNIQEFLSNVQY
jgi:hypothetical protein